MTSKLAVIFLFATTLVTHAEFRAPPEFDGGSFECSIVKEKPKARDDDPVYKINMT